MAQDTERIVIKARVSRSLHLKFKKAVIDTRKTQEEIIGQLINNWVEEGLTSKDLLQKLTKGIRPSDAEISEVANRDGLESEAIYDLCDRLFSNGKKTNGATK